MTRRRAALLVRIAVLAGAVALLEICCRLGIIDSLTIIAPSEMIVSMIDRLSSGELNESIVNTFSTILLAFVLAIGCGTLAGSLIHRSQRLRDVVDPLLASYYSVPTFIFYPLLVALLGLGKAPLVVLGVLSATPAVMISTLSGLDSVPTVLMKLARPLGSLMLVPEAKVLLVEITVRRIGSGQFVTMQFPGTLDLLLERAELSRKPPIFDLEHLVTFGARELQPLELLPGAL